MTTQITLILSNALIIGVILTHLILTTPAVFRALEGESVSKFLRVIFPRYYLLLLLLSFPVLVVLYFQDVTSYWWLAVNVSFHAALGFLTIPLTNAAKDRGWEFQIWTEDTLKDLGIKLLSGDKYSYGTNGFSKNSKRRNKKRKSY